MTDLPETQPDSFGDLMQPTSGGPSSRMFLRILLLAVGCVLLVGAFAIASHPERNQADRENAPGAITLVRDGFLALAIALMIASAAFLIYILWPRKTDEPIELPLREQSNLPWWLQLILGLGPMLITMGLLYWLLTHRSEDLQEMLGGLGLAANSSSNTGDQPQSPDRSLGEYWLSIASIAAVIAVAAVFLTMAFRRRRRPEDDDFFDDDVDALGLSAELRAEADFQLDEIASSANPREAVIAAYAALEVILHRHGLGRKVSETVTEFAQRIAGTGQVAPAAMSGLTRLYELARYSRHEIDTDMQRDAISALTEIRDAL